MSDKRRYSEAELRTIFERAAERQEEARRAEAASAGELTLAELQEIGAASGIDPDHVAAAAAELNRPAPPAKQLLGTPVEVRRSRFIPGPVTDEAWEQMVAELRRIFDQPGMAGEVGRVREWTTQARRRHGSAVHVALEPVEGGARVTIEQSMRGSALGLAIVSAVYAAVALLFGVLLATGVVDPSVALLPALFAAFAVLMFGGSRIGFRLYAKRQEGRFEHALDRLDLLARDAGTEEAGTTSTARNAAPEPEAAPDASAAPPERRLDLDRLPDEPEGTNAAERHRTRS